MRTKEEINQEYSNCAAQLGDVSFKMKLMAKKKEDLEKKMQECHEEVLLISSPLSSHEKENMGEMA